MRVPIIVGTVVFMLCAGAQSASAQDATLVGTVMDESKAVMPGATITATDTANGRQFVALTGTRGEYRIPGVAAGRYRVQAELQGFASTSVQVELLVGAAHRPFGLSDRPIVLG